MATIAVIIGICVVWGISCVIMYNDEKPKDYPTTEPKNKKPFCEIIKDNKINGDNSSTKT